MGLNIDLEIAKELGMSPEIKPTVSIKDAWLVAEAVMKEPDTSVLIRNCKGNKCCGIKDGVAKEGDFFCNVITEGDEYDRPILNKAFAPTMPMAVSLAVCKYLGIKVEEDK